MFQPPPSSSGLSHRSLFCFWHCHKLLYLGTSDVWSELFVAAARWSLPVWMLKHSWLCRGCCKRCPILANLHWPEDEARCCGVEVTAFLFGFQIEVICLSGDLLSKVIGTSVLLQRSSTHTCTLFPFPQIPANPKSSLCLCWSHIA